MNNYDFFSSPIGLGHVTRDIAIVKNLKDFSFNFVTGSGAAKILKKINYKKKKNSARPKFERTNIRRKYKCLKD